MARRREGIALRESASPGGARPRTLRAGLGKSLKESVLPGGARGGSLFEKGWG